MEVKRLLNYISILLILIPFGLIFTINVKYLNEVGMIFYLLYWILPITVGYIMYLCTADYKHEYSRKLFVWSNILLAIIAGSALLMGISFALAIIFWYWGVITISIVLNRGFLIALIFAEHKKIILSIKGFLILLIMVLIPIVSNQIYLKSTQAPRIEVGEDIPTLADFKRELENRELILEDADDYRLYGIKEDNIHIFSFDMDNLDSYQYPMYIYAPISKKRNVYDEYYVSPWTVYYINGNIYASKGNYTKEKSEEKIGPLTVYIPFISESENITVYNLKNYYEIGTTIESYRFEAGYTNKNIASKYSDYSNAIVAVPMISVNPEDEYSNFIVRVVNRVDKESVEKILN